MSITLRELHAVGSVVLYGLSFRLYCIYCYYCFLSFDFV